MCEIKQLTENDKDSYIELRVRVSLESGTMAIEPSESLLLSNQLEKMFGQSIAKPNLIFGAFIKCDLVGFLALTGFAMLRKRHSGSIVMGVDATKRRQGIGTQLLKELDSVNLERIELTTIETNIAAINLYKSAGFVVEGIRRNSLKISNANVNEFIMAKYWASDILLNQL